MIQDWINVLDGEHIFWHRVHNLETALKNAKNKYTTAIPCRRSCQISSAKCRQYHVGHLHVNDQRALC